MCWSSVTLVGAPPLVLPAGSGGGSRSFDGLVDSAEQPPSAGEQRELNCTTGMHEPDD